MMGWGTLFHSGKRPPRKKLPWKKDEPCQREDSVKRGGKRGNFGSEKRECLGRKAISKALTQKEVYSRKSL